MKFGRAAIIALLIACVLGLLWIFAGHEAPAAVVGNANVIGALASVLALALTVVLLWSRAGAPRAEPDGVTAEQAQAAVEYLAVETLRSWQIQAKDRRITTPSPAMVSWKWASEDVAAPAQLRPELLTEGVVTRLREQLYERLDAPARVVVLGGAGAGKTTAMLLLLIDILEHRATGATQPVPVWLTLGGWNPESTSLREWAATVLKRDYPGLSAADHGGPAAATELIRTGRVALFLDGLDEMSPALQGRALELIDRDAVGLRVVMTSRPAEYQAAIEEGRLYRAAVIDVLPVKPEHARDFLLADQVGKHRRAWQQVADHLAAHPESVVARTLTSPLALSLAREAYARSDPMALLDTRSHPTPDALLRHLLAQSLHLAYPNQAERDHAMRWLAWIAQQMRMDASRDLRWWDIPTWISNRQRQFAFGTFVFLMVGLAVGLADGLIFGLADGLAEGLTDGLTEGLVLGLPAGFASGLRNRLTDGLTTPQSLFVRRPTRQEGKRLPFELARGLAVGLAVGLTVGLAVGLTVGLAVGLAVGLTDRLTDALTFVLLFGLALGLILGLILGLVAVARIWSRPMASVHSARPAETYHLDRRRIIVLGLIFGLAIGLAIGLIFGLADGLTIGLIFELTIGLEDGLIFGLAVGLTAGLVTASGPALELAKAEFVLRVRGQRVRFMPLLETALKRQVLRQAGAVYQFRHAALQDLLASSQPAVPAARQPEPLPAHPIGPADLSDRSEQAEEAGPRSAG